SVSSTYDPLSAPPSSATRRSPDLADSTTRTRRKAAALQQTYDHLEERIARLTEEEELAAIRPDLDGHAIMSILGVSPGPVVGREDRKSTRLNSSHVKISYAVFCLK